MKNWQIGGQMQMFFNVQYILDICKVLTVVWPNGFVGYFYGPVSGWENDIGALNMPGLNQHLMALQPEVTAALSCGEAVLYYALFGDAIFLFLQCITSQH
jgi:hypothetical protein